MGEVWGNIPQWVQIEGKSYTYPMRNTVKCDRMNDGVKRVDKNDFKLQNNIINIKWEKLMHGHMSLQNGCQYIVKVCFLKVPASKLPIYKF